MCTVVNVAGLSSSNNLGEFNTFHDIDSNGLSCGELLEEILEYRHQVHRGSIVHKVYFKVNGLVYIVYRDGSITCEGGVVNPCCIKGGIYAGVNIGGVQLSFHRLMVTLFEDYDDVKKVLYGDLAINHTVLVPNRKNLGRDMVQRIKNNVFEANPDYLECVTPAENNAHSRFVREFGIEFTHVSAKDIDSLRTLMLDLVNSTFSVDQTIDRNRLAVEKFYRDCGFTGQIIF